MNALSRLFHFSRRFLFLAAMLLLVGPIAGCAVWKRETWDFNRYRDERAVDIDRRLDNSGPIVPSPF